MGRVREEKSKSEKIQDKKKVGSKKMQAREKVRKSRFVLRFPMNSNDLRFRRVEKKPR